MEDDLLKDLEELMTEEQRKEHPDCRITVYCDRHLGVKMRNAKTWGSIEWDESSADVHTKRHWYCPKPECFRSYEPTLFGYHWDSGEPGSRMQINPIEQHRGNHPELPFMYIGRVGDGRKFMCPFYKCDELGPEVAAFLVDEEVQISADPSNDLKGAERKRAIEMSVFQSFAFASGLPIDEGSAENRDPDYPDILCTISSQKYWFELGRIIDEEVAEKLNPYRRKQDSGFSYD
jgi:hypothetical protein